MSSLCNNIQAGKNKLPLPEIVLFTTYYIKLTTFMFSFTKLLYTSFFIDNTLF